VQPATPAQDELYRRAGRHLRAAFGEPVLEAPDEPAYFVPLGSIGVRVNIEPIGEHDAVLQAYAWVAQGLPVTPEIGLYLAERNIELRFGSLCVDGEDAIILQHTLFSEATSETVLDRLVRAIAESAQTLDDELRLRFG
jgi:hypothetical protein